MYRLIYWFSAFILLSTFIQSAQSQDLFPGPGFLYSDEEVPRIDITIDPAYIDLILQDVTSNEEYPAQFKMTRGIDVRTIENVGFRLRGNTSRFSSKKSFKISINSFTPGKKWQGVEKINLNGEHNDPSIARAKLCWDLFREAGVPAPRANHVSVYINGDYVGLYLNVEHIDEEFVDTRFGNNDGNLYKCLWPADLNYLGSNPDLYKFTQNDRRAYDLKRNEEIDDYSDLAQLIDVINNTSPSDFQEYLEPVFDVNTYLKNLVVEVITGHWDAYSFNKNNYYLYRNESNNKFQFIPYDTDNTFGIDWFIGDLGTRDIYNWTSDEERPLTENLLENPVYRDRFSFFMNRFLTESFSASVLSSKADALRDKIAPFTIDDVFRTYDYGYTYEDFYNSFEIATGDHVKYGIKSYINARHSSASSQLELNEISPIISWVQHNSPEINESIIITALVEDEEIPDNVSLFTSDGGEYINNDMLATGNGYYSSILPAVSNNGSIKYYLEATDIHGNLSREPFVGEYTIDITTGLKDKHSFIEVDVYPNPFTESIQIRSGINYSKINYSLSDISGKIIQRGELGPSVSRININDSKLSAGVYILLLEFEDWKGVIISTGFKKLFHTD